MSEGVSGVSRNSVLALSLASWVSSQGVWVSVLSSLPKYRSIREGVRSSVPVGVLAFIFLQWSIKIVSLFFCFGTSKQECTLQAIFCRRLLKFLVMWAFCRMVGQSQAPLKIRAPRWVMPSCFEFWLQVRESTQGCLLPSLCWYLLAFSCNCCVSAGAAVGLWGAHGLNVDSSLFSGFDTVFTCCWPASSAQVGAFCES